YYVLFFFFFQAEDGIRDRNVTGVQTCALPILSIIPAYTIIVLNVFCDSLKCVPFALSGSSCELTSLCECNCFSSSSYRFSLDATGLVWIVDKVVCNFCSSVFETVSLLNISPVNL